MTPWKLQQQTQTDRPTNKPTNRQLPQSVDLPTTKKRPKVLGRVPIVHNLTEENYRNSIQRLSMKADGCVLTTAKSSGIEDAASAFVELVPLELVEAPVSLTMYPAGIKKEMDQQSRNKR